MFDSKLFHIKNIFEISTGANIPNNLLLEGDIPRISATAQNNGIQTYTQIVKDNKKFRTNSNFISLSFLGDAFYHPYLASVDMKIHMLKPKKVVLNKYLGLYLVTALNKQMSKYNYGNQLSMTTLKKEDIILPCTEEGLPDWKVMEEYIKYKENDKLNLICKIIKNKLNKLVYKKISNLSSIIWEEIFITDIGNVKSGKDISKKSMVPGDTPYISATSQNNGVSAFISNHNNTLEEDCISINRNGSVGYAFYHPYPALFSNDCRKLITGLDKYSNLFIVNQIKAQKDKYNYGYKMGTNRIKRQKILLPVKDNAIDYDYMRQYMVNKEITALTKYLNYIQNKQKIKGDGY